MFLLLTMNAGLLLVDHVHFQYNGFVIGKTPRAKTRQLSTTVLAPQPFASPPSERVTVYTQPRCVRGCCPAGILLWSLYWLMTESYWLAGVAYTCVVHLKHLYVYCAPIMLVYIARRWCGFNVAGISHFVLMAATVLGISAVSLGPFIQAGQLQQVRPPDHSQCTQISLRTSFA